MMAKRTGIGIVFFFSTFAFCPAQSPPDYGKQIQPFFAKYCVECHNAKRPCAGLNLETYKGLKTGSDNGPVLVPGKADKSLLVLAVEGKKKPFMPPKKVTVRPTSTEIALLRSWVNAGAKGSAGAIKVVLPAIKSKIKAPVSITALAYLPKGWRLLAGTFETLVILDAKSGKVEANLIHLPGMVTALAVTKDGKRLAVACGTPGVSATIQLYNVPEAGQSWKRLRQIPQAHADVIQRLAFSPDGKTLITCGYDRKVKIWDSAIGKVRKVLKEHSDAVYGLSFRPDGKLFATAGADRAVKVWETSTAKLLYTLGEATDWVYTTAWSPDGQHLAAAGVDKSIRVWKADRDSGKVVHSVFAHQGPVLQIAYSPKGDTLYSISEDRTIKAWDAKKMVERKVYGQQTDTPLSLAVSPDGRQIAVGRFDGMLVFIDVKTGKVREQKFSERLRETKVSRGGVLENGRPRSTALPCDFLELKPEALAKETRYLSFACASGFDGAPDARQSRGTRTRGSIQQVMENEPNNSPRSGQTISVPAVIKGTLQKAGDGDFFRFHVKAGQQLGVQAIVVKNKGKAAFQPYLRLTDDAGRVLAQSETAFLGYTFEKAGWYALGIRDREFGGNAGMKYTLNVGRIPVVTSVFPLGIQRGKKANLQLEGVFLGKKNTVPFQVDAKAEPESKLPVKIKTPWGKPLGNPQIFVGEFPEVMESEGKSPQTLPVPGTANGRLLRDGETDLWRFSAKKGQRLLIEVNAHRLGSDLDSFIEILDAKGNLVPRAVLRSQAKTYVVFRDHNSVQGNIRIEAWSELAVNDYIYVGNELLKIRQLPTHPDADCNFFTRKGQRIGYLGTTPSQISKGEAMYKVSIHPPGTKFSPNGFPVVTLYYHNEDGGAGFGRDSRLVFDPPADGEYTVRIGDSRGRGGKSFAYRLTIRPPQPDYTIRFSPKDPVVSKGGAIPITVTAERFDEFDGPIDVLLQNLPPGFEVPPTTIPGGQESTTVALWAKSDARTPLNWFPLSLIARAKIDGRLVYREFTGGHVKAIKPGDIVTKTDESEITLHPGGTTKLTVRIERRNGFKGRVPINVDGLPHGVKVLDIGLNGILITEKETQRTMVLYCHPWVEPMEHPIVVTARREGKNSKHSARSVLLKIVKSKGK